MTALSMTIAGEPTRSGSDVFDVLNPATGEPCGQAPACSAQQLDTTMAAAQSAFESWRSDDSARKAALLRAAEVLFASADELGRIVTTEQGKPLEDAVAEISGAGVWFKYFARLDVPQKIIQDNAKGYAEAIYRPLGVVAAITPWNYPIFLAAWKLAPALRAGNTVVLKPSPFTPLATLRLGELLRDVFPPGVLNVVSGHDELGALMTVHRTPRKISFTGSVETGKAVAGSAAKDLKRITLELGGNDPAIVLDDADPAAIIGKLFWGAFVNSGQACAAMKRLYVPEAMYNEVVDGLAALARSVRVGNGMTEGTQIGPLSTEPQFERVGELVDDAISGGARVAAGGRPAGGPGYFFEPTILADVAEGVRIVDEEQFGPALPVIAYRDVEDVVHRANATHYGLAASVWGGDVDRAADVAAGLEAGTTWVNSHLVLAPQQPFGGAKWSGVGVENGLAGYETFTEQRIVYRPSRPA
jgi:acyl-CoA reductase-like NAD-dependent aldehyde dehydrogenase